VGAGPCCGAGLDGREGDRRERLAGVVGAVLEAEARLRRRRADGNAQ